ncbi:lipopolysaccharide export system permease protein [Haloferula luteola]|uniref:Lipopolysaccharide export system permease protein n=1 Tax=Haloferula luteola TaxID=595692 RepID=A0A840V954_9BACT|nr:LptF/LptG family permease [Haloferula luteola]MBB5353596.1 lipopolysaccharide export system permease protein [Haloferula luteola]
MRISDRYIGRHVLTGTLFAIVLLSLLLVLGNVFKQIRPLLVEFGAPIWVLGEFTLSVLPVSLIFTIPWAFLSAVLLVFGRLSSDNELNAFRAAGVSLARLSAPVIAIGTALSLFCLWLNLGVAPKASKEVEDIVRSTLIRDPRTLLRAGVDQSRFKNIRVYSENDNGEVFENFHIFKMGSQDGGEDTAYIHAHTATTVNDSEKQEIRLKFTEAYVEGTPARKSDEESQSTPQEFVLLSDELEWMLLNYSRDFSKDKVKPKTLTNPELDAIADNFKPLPLGPKATKAELKLQKARKKIRERYLAEKTRRYTSSFACLAFAFIGIPLGMKARRRDTSTGLIISLGIGALYFLASSMIEPSEGMAYLLWIPNILCVALGFFFFRRARFR